MISLRKAWSWLSDSRHQKTLSFLGAGLVVVVSGGWQVYQYFSAPRPENASEVLARANVLKEQAWAYERRNDLVNAELLLKESVEVLKKGLAPDNPNVARHLVYLASFYRGNDLDRGRVEPLLRQALAIDEKALGPDDPVVAGNLEYLAQVLRKANRGDEAAPLETRARQIRAANK